MQRSQKLTALVAGAFVCGALTVAPALAQVKSVGIIDRDRVVGGYAKAQQAADELKKAEEKVQQLVENANKQYEDAKKANKPPAELEGLQKRLQTTIDNEVKTLQTRMQTLEKQLEGEIDTAIKAEATARNVDVVLMKQAVLLGGTDITEGVVKRLGGQTAAAQPKPNTTK
ncbi:MAG: OmpH family outer membrane protein [Candidatus Obscuribacterales bacterium]|jgi:Skp family chaperone for outer membrane proteins